MGARLIEFHIGIDDAAESYCISDRLNITLKNANSTKWFKEWQAGWPNLAIILSASGAETCRRIGRGTGPGHPTTFPSIRAACLTCAAERKA